MEKIRFLDRTFSIARLECPMTEPRPDRTPRKLRLDRLLVEHHGIESRTLAQRLIQAGSVRVNQAVVDKPGTEVSLEAQIAIAQRPPYVSRGGEKLAKALTHFGPMGLAVAGRTCLDGGISTGGFTDCLLQEGASRVYGIDVGYGQVDWGLRNDPRLVLRERTNLRNLQPEDLFGEADLRPDLGVVDVSFISLTKIFPALDRLLIAPRELVLLVKPQFEIGREKIGKNGVVRDPRDQAATIWKVLEAARLMGWSDRGLTWSPLVGPAGNLEYLLWLVNGEGGALDLSAVQGLTVEARSVLGGKGE
jgi:23S rRNA (cytidine1920-2'-O)/16S rRNA (cytidine1409-2'-O)-methyltransferase